jgi:uncharacterized RDD family membrane protein YckC
LAALFVLMAIAFGESSARDGEVSVRLDGGPFLIYLALVLLYYFALEAATGRTLGKLALGVRVVSADGSRPGSGPVALRTVLRLVDWLPILYLVGFVIALVTGEPRRRLGDHAARTRVVRASAEG